MPSEVACGPVGQYLLTPDARRGSNGNPPFYLTVRMAPSSRDREVVERPSQVDGELARLVAEGDRVFVEVWTADGWHRPHRPYPDVAAVLKSPPASRDDLIRRGVPEAIPGDLEPPYPRVVAPPAVIDGQVYRLGSDGSACYVESWESDSAEWRRLRRHERPSCEEVVDVPRASPKQLQQAGLMDLL